MARNKLLECPGASAVQGPDTQNYHNAKAKCGLRSLVKFSVEVKICQLLRYGSFQYPGTGAHENVPFSESVRDFLSCGIGSLKAMTTITSVH